MRRICVFTGARKGDNPLHVEAARALGRALLERGIGLVFGGGKIGLMGEIADVVMAGGGEVLGVIPQALRKKEVAHEGITELRVVASMHERKAMMAELADAFVAMPGGFGTLEEFFEVLTWAQLGFHPKPCGLLDADGHYRGLLDFLDQLVDTGFVAPEHRGLVLDAATPTELLARLEGYVPPAVEQWIDRDSS